MTDLKQAQTHFVELMADLFQLDEAQALDFGIYRVIRHRNNAVRAFLGEVQAKGHDKALVGGELQKILDTAFASKDEERSAELDARLSELEANFGLSAHLTADQRSQKLTELHAIPAMRGSVDEYRLLREQRDTARHGDDDRLEVLNRLHQFFDRHYQDGDFIVQRRYGREGQRYIRSTGQDTEFRWATEDMYYIKSGDIFTDFPVRLANGVQIVFAVDADTLNATRAALKPNDKAHYQLKSAKKDGDAVRVLLEYARGARTKAHEKAIVDAIVGKTGAKAEDVARWLRRYIARNQSDFFIHKRLGEALNEELDIFLKTDVLDADQLLVGHARAQRHTRVAQQVRTIGREIIAFLAALEDFQKQLWEKKKLVLETRYIITLDRIEKLAGKEWLEERLPAIIKAQRKEWKALGLGDYAKPKDCLRDERDLLDADASRYLPLPVDSGEIGDSAHWELMAALSASGSLEEAVDGIAMRADNWQALALAQPKQHGRIKCVYIDPPYNTGSDGFAYKDAYPSASWLAMMDNRLGIAKQALRRDGVLFSSIDQNEYPHLRLSLSAHFGRANALGTVVWKNVTDNNPTNIAIEHEYVECFAKDRGALESEWKSPYSAAKDLLVALGAELIEKHGDTPALREAYSEWFKVDKHFLGPLDRYKYIDKDGIYTGSQSVHNPGKEGYRYDILHPETGKPCKQPLMGYRFPEDTYKRLYAEGRILFGKDETKLIELKVYAHEYEAKLPSVIELDGRSGANDLTNLFGEAQTFKNPKASALLQEILPYAAGTGDWVLDFFAGSGTTSQAVMRLNDQRDAGLRWMIVEANHYFDSLVVPRLKKQAYSTEWLKGKPSGTNKAGTCIRVQRIENYEDTLENLALAPEQGESATLPFDDGPTALRWKLDEEARRVYCAIEHYRSPFGYTLRRAEGAGSAEKVPVDLVESLVWLLGLDVARMWHEPQGVAITGKNRRDESVLVAFRECDVKGSGDWVMRLMAEHPAERVYSNDPADLVFPGADRLEAIEAVFASQFGAA